jgi:hypothetical protein
MSSFIMSGSQGPIGPEGFIGPKGPFGIVSNVNYLDTTYEPVGLWNFNKVLTDNSGNGFDLTLSGTAKYAIIPGFNLTGFMFNGSSYLYRPTNDAALTITGELTIETIIYMPLTNAPTTSNLSIISFGSSGDAEANNYLYKLTGSNGTKMTIFSELDAGIDNYAETANVFTSQVPLHLVITRNLSGDTIKLYLNGVLTNTLTGLIKPTGGTSSFLYIGADSSGYYLSNGTVIFSVKILNKELTQAQILSEYNNSIGDH